ncbi:uncharacterized protein B0H18DRAFT_1168583 [Fomitopsis serialis]|uniref:uncharacterized protein n=1 Tax=Fomitopsis serialis TaxID=139415 RepID=UPI002008793A|nr:uncharacterized protein B0H18DRAFT_1168583 [Neoantrodia serialis]KAH9911489.1 hypothetical protein B0H18DRAFT_1168583 [Neoantrodia serialis]
MELLRLEGRAGFTDTQCPTCHDGIAEYRCEDCADLQLYCADCTAGRHMRLPLHRIKRWAEAHFQHANLKSLGVSMQMGHPSGQRCPNPKPAFDDDFVILDVSGIHHVALDFCNCHRKVHLPNQLMRARLFPATVTNPKTAATFALMELFHLLRTQSKISAYEFYHTLARRTENVAPRESTDRYPAFLRMSRAWSHLKMLKRAGRGHDVSGVGGTARGECAVECPACPHPGKNLPDNWKEAPEGEKWLYRLFVGLDANFRLKRKKVSSVAVDPGLNQGFAYFVEDHTYKAFLNTFDTKLPPETNTCHNHDAVKLANIKKIRETDASGVATVECVRHDMKRPASVGDLQYGERYVNMDYLYFSSLTHHCTVEVVTSYDISCQWSRNLPARQELYGLQFDRIQCKYLFLMPKHHLNAHRLACQTAYSFNYTKGVGRTDGEAVERGWAAVNPFASSTKEMGPGHRRDVLDDVFGNYNWGKVRKLGPTLCRKLEEALEHMCTLRHAFEEFGETLPLESVRAWTELVEKWEIDPANFENPFVTTEPVVTVAAVRRQLAEEEAARLQAGHDLSYHASMSPSIMLAAGLDLENLQCRLRREFRGLGEHSTDKQHATIQERLNSLRRRLEAWFKIQHAYIPGAEAFRERLVRDTNKDVPAYDIPVLLPSGISSALEVSAFLQDIEWRLRHAQAHDALSDLRRHLHLRSHLYSFKDRFIRGQQANTRARSIINTTQAKVDENAERYRRARAALVSLSDRLGRTGWEATLQVLEDQHVRGLKLDESEETEGRRTLSWIWRTTPLAGPENADDPHLQEALRVEWCKSRARAHRWEEEVHLLVEEMRRVLAYHQWMAQRWLGRHDARQDLPVEVQEGLSAYALRQAEIRTTLRSICARTWQDIGTWVTNAMELMYGDGVLATPDTSQPAGAVQPPGMNVSTGTNSAATSANHASRSVVGSGPHIGPDSMCIHLFWALWTVMFLPSTWTTFLVPSDTLHLTVLHGLCAICF